MSVNDHAGTTGTTRPGNGIRRFWWVVLGLMVISIVGAVATTLSVSTTYTGRSSMIVSSNNRSPDQDAVLVQGYVDYFNNRAYQSQLLEQARVDEPVTVTARAAAASPIMVVEATSSSADTARRAASAVASAFRMDVNEEREKDQADETAALQTRIEELIAAPLPGSDAAIELLQERIAAIQTDHTNELQVLQLRGGVAANSADLLTNVLFAALGGLLLGVLAALALDRLFPRRTAVPHPRSEDWSMADALSTKV